MIRVIAYAIVYIFSIIISNAQIKSEEILVNNQAIQLPGTLTYTKEKSPLIIWVHGSGGVDRNGNQPQYIKQFRNAINNQNIAFFSYDKRTANPKNANFLKDGVYFTDFIFDLQEVVNHFKNDNRFTSIILIGHSQGSLVAMKALKNVDKYISLAGAGEIIDKIIVRQLAAQNPSIKKPLQAHFKELKETGTIKNVDLNLMGLFSKKNQAFWLSWIQLNPLEEIKKITIPTLNINGDKDLQVLIADAEALKKAKPDATYVIIKNMNHVLKTVNSPTENKQSYYDAQYPLSKELITNIVTFINK